MIEVPPDVRLSIVVAQATGVIARSRDLEVIEAFDRLQALAVELDQSLEHTALDVLDGVIRFDPSR